MHLIPVIDLILEDTRMKDTTPALGLVGRELRYIVKSAEKEHQVPQEYRGRVLIQHRCQGHSPREVKSE